MTGQFLDCWLDKMSNMLTVSWDSEASDWPYTVTFYRLLCFLQPCPEAKVISPYVLFCLINSPKTRDKNIRFTII